MPCLPIPLRSPWDTAAKESKSCSTAQTGSTWLTIAATSWSFVNKRGSLNLKLPRSVKLRSPTRQLATRASNQVSVVSTENSGSRGTTYHFPTCTSSIAQSSTNQVCHPCGCCNGEGKWDVERDGSEGDDDALRREVAAPKLARSQRENLERKVLCFNHDHTRESELGHGTCSSQQFRIQG